MANIPARYAVVQSTAVPPSAAQLREAFEVLPGLVDADASYLAKDCFGIVIDSLTRGDAELLTSALRKLGARVEIVCQDDLYLLPGPRRLHLLELGAEHFTAQDAMGRRTVIAWSHVVVVAAFEEPSRAGAAVLIGDLPGVSTFHFRPVESRC